jgi:hypothetical protein
MNVFEQAKYHGVSMSELGLRGGQKTGRKKQRKSQLEKEFEAIKERGGDYWNN